MKLNLFDSHPEGNLFLFFLFSDCAAGRGEWWIGILRDNNISALLQRRRPGPRGESL